MLHNFKFDPAYGYDLEALKRVGAPEPPENFQSFWQDTYEQALALPLNLSCHLIDEDSNNLDVWEVEFDSLDDVRIGGWVTAPRNQELKRAVVVGHGYGGRDQPQMDLPGPPAAAIFPCMRGFNRSARADLPNVSSRHVLHGIADRRTYIHRGCAADLWRAGLAVLEMFPELSHNLQYHGGSFGGGIGALMLPWDGRFKRAFLSVPSFGNHRLRVTLPCTGSGQAVRRKYLAGDESILKVLSYFDAATAAKFIHIPVMCACAKFDPAVPPPGQFAVYNALAGERSLFVKEAGHFDWPGKQAEEININDAVSKWMDELIEN